MIYPQLTNFYIKYLKDESKHTQFLVFKWDYKRWREDDKIWVGKYCDMTMGMAYNLLNKREEICALYDTDTQFLEEMFIFIKILKLSKEKEDIKCYEKFMMFKDKLKKLRKELREYNIYICESCS